jgi:hypothetical protein
MNLTSAAVRRGDSTINVRVTTPQWTDLASIESRCRVKIASLVFTLVPPTPAEEAAAAAAVPAPAAPAAAAAPAQPPVTVRYGMGCVTTMTTNTYPFHIVTSVPRNNTSTKLSTKFYDHHRLAQAYFPLQEHLPRLYYVGEDVEPEDPHFELELPPHTMFFTSSAMFWGAIGFTGATRESPAAPWAGVRKIGGRLQRAASVMVYGYINKDLHETVVHRGNKVFPGQMLDSSLEQDAPMPGNMRFQMELIPRPEQLLESAHAAGVTKPELVVGLTRLLEEVRGACGLRSTQVDVQQGVKNVVEMTSRTMAGSKTRLILMLSDPLSAVLGHPLNLPLIFDLELPPKTIKIRLAPGPAEVAAAAAEAAAAAGGGAQLQQQQQTTGRVDPFRGRYPVLIVLRGYGVSKTFVQDRGYLTPLGRLEERKVVPVDGVGLEMAGSETVLSIEFLDCDRQPFVFERAMTANFIFDFVKLVM